MISLQVAKESVFGTEPGTSPKSHIISKLIGMFQDEGLKSQREIPTREEGAVLLLQGTVRRKSANSQALVEHAKRPFSSADTQFPPQS